MLKKIVWPLIAWYEENKRDLPWRQTRDPYPIWVSEIMLQQTRVEAVKPYYHRFIEALPTVADLAACPEDQLLKLWEGLGYYSRVRNMQKAACEIVRAYGGRIPADEKALLALPGIGSYTAGAIASQAFGIPAPAVDGNVLRVLSRIRESREDILVQSVKRDFENQLREVMQFYARHKGDGADRQNSPDALDQLHATGADRQNSPEVLNQTHAAGTDHQNSPVALDQSLAVGADVRYSPGTFNQALMELGATVCVPKGTIRCELCPVRDLCLAHLHGTAEELPVRKAAKPRKIEERTVLMIRDGDHVAIRRRPARGLLAGLYELPNWEGYLTDREVFIKIEKYGLSPLHIEPLGEARHIFSHVEWRMIGYAVRVAQLEQESCGDLLFVDREKAEESYAIPAAFSAYTGVMQMRLGNDRYR